jgi:hypothetical protein
MEPRLTAALSAQDWNVVLAALNEAPMPLRMTFPVLQQLQAQLQARPAAQPDVSSASPVPNGVEAEPA